jgi:exodeoxyribonuclease V alpha subunit
LSGVDRNARELRGVIDVIRYRKEDTGWTIATLRASSNGSANPGDAVIGVFAEKPARGVEYHFFAGRKGGWQINQKFGGWDFRFEDAQPLFPESSEGVEGYLEAHAPWIGSSAARRIVLAFGPDALSILKNDPARVACEIKGITPQRAEDIRAALVAREAVEKIEVDVRGLVAPANVNGRQLRSILDRYGKEAASVVRGDPYRLIDDVDGIGWETADAIAMTPAVGIDRAAPCRLRAGIMHALKQAENEHGHTCVAFGVLVGEAAAILAGDPRVVEARVRELAAVDERGRGGELVTLPIDGETRVYRSALFEAERGVATAIVKLLSPRGVGAEPVDAEAARRELAAALDEHAAARERDPLACLDTLGEAPAP